MLIHTQGTVGVIGRSSCLVIIWSAFCAVAADESVEAVLGGWHWQGKALQRARFGYWQFLCGFGGFVCKILALPSASAFG